MSRIKTEKNDNSIKFWPNARPQAHELVVLGKEVTVERDESKSHSSFSVSTSSSGSISLDSATIPATIHPEIRIVGDDNFNGIIESGETGLSAYVQPAILPATQPYSVFPTGKFILRINASPYRLGYTRVDALIIDITSAYV